MTTSGNLARRLEDVRADIVLRYPGEARNGRHALSRDAPGLAPADDGRVVKAQPLRERSDAPSFRDDFGDLHGREKWDIPTYDVKGNVGSSHPHNVGIGHSASYQIGALNMERADEEPTAQEKMHPGLGERLRTLREHRSLNQIDVAVAVGVSRPHLSKIERGGDEPGRALLMKLAEFYEVNLDWLATGHGEMHAGAAGAKDEDEALLLYAWRSLPKQEAKPLLEMLLSRVKPRGS